MTPEVERKANEILEQAKAIAPDMPSWADFSNKIFGVGTGLATQAFTTPEERREWLDSPQYAVIGGLVMDLMKKFGTVEGANPKL